MRERLDHLPQPADRLNITIQMVPARPAVYPELASGVTLMRFEEGPDAVFQDGLAEPAGSPAIPRLLPALCGRAIAPGLMRFPRTRRCG